MAISFSKIMSPPTGNNLLLVDSMNLAFRWKHQGKTIFKEDYQRTVDSLAKSYDCSKVIIAADLGSSTFRKNIFPEYKQNRRDKAELQTPEEKEEFNRFFEEYERTLEFLPYPKLRYKGVEADDIAAYMVKKLDYFKFNHIWLVSSDKDWDLLVTDKSSRFSYVTRKNITINEWPYEVSHEEYISWKALIGDPGDNIDGISGIGPKRAAALIKEYGSAFDVYEACPIESKYKYIQALNAEADKILRNLELMDLFTYCEEAIGPENLKHLESTVVEYMGDRD